MAFFEFERRVFIHLQWGLILCMLALSLIGILAIIGSEKPTEPHAAKQVLWTCVGLVAFVFTVSINPRWLRRVTPYGYAALFLFLLGLLVWGTAIKGSTSWIRLGPIRLQPSEFMKIATVLLIADIVAKGPERIRTPFGLAIPILITALPATLILKQPDFGTAAVFAPALFVVLWLGGARLRHLVLLVVFAAALGALAYPQLKPYQRARIQSFFNPSADVQGRDYNINQARITLGSGRLIGRTSADESEEGSNEVLTTVYNRTELKFLPEAHTDFIYAALGEQWGFVGCSLVILLYVIFAAISVMIAVQARTLFSGLMVMGLLAIVLTHVVFNIGMNLSLMPVTGLPLPFLSYGGSSMLTNFVIGGLICNVAARRFEYDPLKL